MFIGIRHHTDTFYQHQVRDSTWNIAAGLGKGNPKINQMTVDFIELGGKEWGCHVYNHVTDGVVMRSETLGTSVNNRMM